MSRTVTKIPATIDQRSSSPLPWVRKRRVAAYARVSTDHEEQLTSYEAQVDYYTSYIKGRSDWEFVAVYADEGISGCSTKRREGFKNMVADALDGKIDLVITKSVSRFARNTVDSLTTIRQLKDKGIEVYFEKENIWTFDGKGELLLTIMASIAQEEARSISENVTWGHRKRFADGKVSLAYSHFLGYDKGSDGGLVVNEEQAKTVRLIYRLFLEGRTPHGIAKELTARKILTPGGLVRWSASTVWSILSNEKYKGDALLQKRYTVDFLTKKQVINHGEIPQYYVENDHEGIVTAEIFDAVQQEMERRRQGTERYSGTDIFASRIRCGQCGGLYGAKVWHSNSKYRRVVYQCNRKFAGDEKCSTPHLTEDEIKQVFISAVNELLSEKEEVIANITAVIETIGDCTELRAQEAEVRSEMQSLFHALERYARENAQIALNQTEYRQRYQILETRYNAAEERLRGILRASKERTEKRDTLRRFVHTLEAQESIITEFDADLWGGLIDHIEVHEKPDIRCVFRDGTEI